MSGLWRAVFFSLLLALGGLTTACGDDCEGSCECDGNACFCAGQEDCLVGCGDECSLDCTGSGACDFACDDACEVSCTGSGPCLAVIGDNSVVDCTGSGGCEVDCEGDCAVSCPGSGACTVFCEPDFACTLDECSGQAQTCADGSLVCNASCP